MIVFFYRKHKARQAKRAAQADQVGDPIQTTTTEAPGESIEPTVTSGSTTEEAKPAEEKVSLCSHQQGRNEAALESSDGAVELEAPRTDKKGKCLECAKEKRRARIYRLKLVIVLLLPQFLASIDTTVVATALTTISSHFDQLQQFNWIVTAYTLTSTAFIPVYGQISDIFGRHVALQISMAWMVVGSVLCAAAQSWGMLLLGRALQGLSAAGIMNMIKIVLSDNVSLADNSKNNTLFALVGGISYAVGPIIGGNLAKSNWRYCFVISIPVAVLAHVLIFFLLRKELKHGSHHLTGPERKSLLSGLATIDYGGICLFVAGACLLILGVTWGGTQHPWSSYQVLVPLVIGAVLFLSFFLYEYLLEPGNVMSRVFPSQVAMIPWKLFERKDTALMTVVNAATGAALYSAFYFIGVFWTLAENYNPAKAGTQLLYYTPGIGVGVYAAMFICNVFPRQTFYPLFLGSIVEATGFSVLAWATQARNGTAVNIMMAVSGAGTGLRFMPNTLHMAGVWPQKLTAAMSLMDFALPFGGTLAIAIMSSVFYNKFSDSLKGLSVGSNATTLNAHNRTSSLQGIQSLPAPLQDLIRQKAARAVMWSFVSVLPLMALSIMAAMALGNVWIKPRKEASGSRSKGEVLYGSFLIALFTGQVKSKKQAIDDAGETTDRSRNEKPAYSPQNTTEGE